MRQSPDNLLPENWHKYFAIEANNAAWSMSEAVADVSLRIDLLDAAHAAAWHWRVVGKTAEFQASRQAAIASIALIRDKNDREVVLKTFQHIAHN